MRPGALDIFLLLARLWSGGALVLAAIFKLKNPLFFGQSISNFDLIPRDLIPFLSFGVPYTELIAGTALLVGLWGREAALVTTGLYSVFTLAVISVVWRDIPVDCGCFGNLFGKGEIGMQTVVRNLVFLGCSGAALWQGAGVLSVDGLIASRTRASTHPEGPDEILTDPE